MGEPAAEREEGDAAPGASPRRRFLGAVTSALSAVIGLVVALPALRLLAFPVRARVVRGGDEPIAVADLDALAPGVPVSVEITATRWDAWTREPGVRLGRVWLVRRADGRIDAYSAICPHLGCGIDWDGGRSCFTCPCHTSRFDRQGARVAGPAPRGMDRLEAIVRGDRVLVRYRRFRQGTSAVEPV